MPTKKKKIKPAVLDEEGPAEPPGTPALAPMPSSMPSLMKLVTRIGAIDKVWKKLPPELYVGIEKHLPQGRAVYGIIERLLRDNDTAFRSSAIVSDACAYRIRRDARTPYKDPKGLEITGISFEFNADSDNFPEKFGLWPYQLDNIKADDRDVLQYTHLCCDMDLADDQALLHIIKPLPGQRFLLRFDQNDVRTALSQFLELVDSSRTWQVNDRIRFPRLIGGESSPMHMWTKEEKVGFAKCVRRYIIPFHAMVQAWYGPKRNWLRGSFI